MNQETLKITGDMRRKAWLLDSPARRTGSDVDGHLRQEDCVGVVVTTYLAAGARRPVRQGEVDGVLRQWRDRATSATPCEGGDVSWREREMRVVLATEQGGGREGRRSRSSPEESLSQSMAFASGLPLGSRDACASSEGVDLGRAARGAGLGGDLQMRNGQITLCGRKILLVEEMRGNGGNSKHHNITHIFIELNLLVTQPGDC
jgi:hypothetical protein